MPTKKSPTQRTLTKLRADGLLAAVVEKWNAHAGVRQDLFGVIDILAISGASTIGIQACAGASHADRRKKCVKSEKLVKWLQSSHRHFEIWSWSQKGPRGKRKLWTARIEPITLEDMEVS